MTTRTQAKPRKTAAAARTSGAGALTGLSFARREEPDAADRITVFEVDGDAYTVPAVVETGDAMGLLLILKDIQDPIRQGSTLIRMLAGDDAFTALMTQAAFTSADWRKLVDSLWQHAFGPLEEVVGSGN